MNWLPKGKFMKRHSIRLVIAAAVACLVSVAVVAPAALAHDPIFLSDDQTTPDVGPFMPDGSISWALYGQVLDVGDTRGFEFDLRDGDELFIGLLIPNLSPEVDLADADLPVLEIERPDGSTIFIDIEGRDVFDEPFSQTSYVNLAEVREPAMAGRYRGVVTGNAPARFSVAIGETEVFFTETERSGDRPGSFAEITVPLRAWYTTPPGGEPTGELADGEAEIDLELIEDAMTDGDGSVAEGVDEDAVMAEAEEVADDATDEELVEEPAADDAMSDEEATDASATEAPSAEEAAADVASSEPAVLADGGGSATWVAPVAIGALAVIGAGAWMARREKS